MPSKNTKRYSLILILADVLILTAVFFIAYYVRTQLDHRDLLHSVYKDEYITGFMVIAPVWIGLFATLGLYSARIYNRRLVEWSKIALGAFMGILLIIGWEYATHWYIFPARNVTLYVLFGSIAALIIMREILREIRTQLFKFGRGISRVMLIGSSAATRDIAAEIADTKRSGYKIVALVGPSKHVPVQSVGLTRFAGIDEALKHIKDLKINTIIQTDLAENEDRNHRVLSAAQINHIRYSFIPGEPEFYTGKNTVDVFLGYPMITISQTPLIGWGAIAKRIFDFFVSILLIIVLSPLLLLVFIIQKLTSRGPALYVSTRLSKFSKPVSLYKFRSMGSEFGKKDASEEFLDMNRPDLAEEYKKNHKVANDPRITWFGKFLRSTSIDELPQLFNVLKGDLSLVGPRPILPQEVNFSQGKTALLHSVKSGVTGLWQVSGRSNLSFDERIELELFYAQNWSFWLDIKILFKTVAVVLRKTGAK